MQPTGCAKLSGELETLLAWKSKQRPLLIAYIIPLAEQS